MAEKKQKIAIGRWVFLGVLILFTMWYFKRGGTFGGSASVAMRGADQVLKAYAQAAESFSQGRPGQTMEGLLELVTKEDSDWFATNFSRINRENADPTKASPTGDPRLAALRILVDRGLNTRNYTIDKREDLSKVVNFTIMKPTPAGEKRMTIAVKKGNDKNWRVEAFNGGKVGR